MWGIHSRDSAAGAVCGEGPWAAPWGSQPGLTTSEINVGNHHTPELQPSNGSHCTPARMYLKGSSSHSCTDDTLKEICRERCSCGDMELEKHSWKENRHAKWDTLRPGVTHMDQGHFCGTKAVGDQCWGRDYPEGLWHHTNQGARKSSHHDRWAKDLCTWIVNLAGWDKM